MRSRQLPQRAVQEVVKPLRHQCEGVGALLLGWLFRTSRDVEKSETADEGDGGSGKYVKRNFRREDTLGRRTLESVGERLHH